jgi:hypothetical protein
MKNTAMATYVKGGVGGVGILFRMLLHTWHPPPAQPMQAPVSGGKGEQGYSMQKEGRRSARGEQRPV